jgi:STE20-like kinase
LFFADYSVQSRHKSKLIFAALKQVAIVEETDLEDYSIEIEILSQCKHKNVVGLHEAYLYSEKLWV